MGFNSGFKGLNRQLLLRPQALPHRDHSRSH